MQMLVVERVTQAVFYAIKQVIWKQNSASSKLHNRELVAAVAKNAIFLTAMADFRMDSNVV